MAMHLSTRRWQDQFMVVAGVWLFVSPWVFAYPPGTPEAWNATLAGAIIGILAAFDLYKTYVWAVLFNIIVGAWVTISPWMVDAVNDVAMTWSLVLAGIATIVLGLWELRSDPELYRQWRSDATG